MALQDLTRDATGRSRRTGKAVIGHRIEQRVAGRVALASDARR